MNGLRLGWLGLAIAVGSTAAAQVTRRVNVSSSGVQVHQPAYGATVSPDGRYVGFWSVAGNLVPGDTNGTIDSFLRDCLLGTIERVSVDSGGAEGNGISSYVSIPWDSRFVVFQSAATNLVPGDTNGMQDIFLRDRMLGTTERVNLAAGGVQGNADSILPKISGDGRFVAYVSTATNLVPGDTNAADDIFVFDRQLGTTERVSVDSGGAQGNNFSGGYTIGSPSISDDGRYVAFSSYATNLVPGDTNGRADIFVRDRQLGTTTRVSVDSGGAQGTDYSFLPSISADGRYAVFESYANNLVSGDTNGLADVFVRDRQLGTTERVSISSGGAEGNADSAGPSISADGRYVTFGSYATNLVPADTNGSSDLFVRDRLLGTTERVSVDSGGSQGDGDSSSGVISISADGRFVVLESLASNLVAGDTNGILDVFFHDRAAAGFTSLCDPGMAGVHACPCANLPSGSGRGCNNSAATGGAVLSAAGIAYLASDSLIFTATGEKPTATSVLLQGTSLVSTGAVYGQGVRCVGGTLKRLFTKAASGGSVSAPNFGAGDPTVSARSAAKGSPIAAGESRWYLIFYRDPIVLGGCPMSSTFNATQTGHVTWSL